VYWVLWGTSQDSEPGGIRHSPTAGSAGQAFQPTFRPIGGSLTRIATSLRALAGEMTSYGHMEVLPSWF